MFRTLSNLLRERMPLIGPVLVLVGLGLFSIPFLDGRPSEWDAVFVRAARHLRGGWDLYRHQDRYSYPPFMAWLALPATGLSRQAASAFWYAINAGAVILLVRSAWRLSGGRAVRSPEAVRERWIYLLGLGCALPYLWNVFAHQQVDVVIGALLMVGCVLAAREQPLWAATCFGLAAAMKGTPLLWRAYFLWRREWRAAGWLVGVAVVANLLPNLASAPPGGGLWVAEWLPRCAARTHQAQHYLGTWASDVVLNQSIAGAAQRLLLYRWPWSAAGYHEALRADAPDYPLFNALVMGVDLLLLVAGFRLIRRGAARSPDEPPAGVPRASLEFGIVFLLMVLLSPMTSRGHYVTLILPAFCAARAALWERDRRLTLLLLGVVVAGALGEHLAGGVIADRLLWFGGVTGAALALLGACGWLLWRANRREVEHGAPARVGLQPSGAGAG